MCGKVRCWSIPHSYPFPPSLKSGMQCAPFWDPPLSSLSTRALLNLLMSLKFSYKKYCHIPISADQSSTNSWSELVPYILKLLQKWTHINLCNSSPHLPICAYLPKCTLFYLYHCVKIEQILCQFWMLILLSNRQFLYQDINYIKRIYKHKI
jgi:hypothetical protein